MLYKKLGYTQQDLEDDNTYYNVTVEDVYIECDIAVEYQLTEKGTYKCEEISTSGAVGKEL